MIYGSRVSDARRYLGETQKQFAETIGLSQSRLSALENLGLAAVADDVLVSLTEHTGFPPEWFHRPSASAIDEIQFRARLTFRAVDRHRTVACAGMVHESFATMRSQLEAIPVRLERRPGDDPRRAARAARAALGLTSGPVSNLTLPLERYGVALLALPVVSGKHDGFSWWNREGGYPVIATMAGGPGDRLRWTLAHELGHLILHSTESGREIEREADEFAAELLTPLAQMEAEMPLRPKLTALYALKVKWGVSVQSLIRRAKDLGRLDDAEYMSLFRQVSARGERMNERYRLDREKPRAYRKMAEVLYGESPAEGLQAANSWAGEFTQEVLAQYATSVELPARRQLIRDTEAPSVGNVIPLSRRRSAAT